MKMNINILEATLDEASAFVDAQKNYEFKEAVKALLEDKAYDYEMFQHGVDALLGEGVVS